MEARQARAIAERVHAGDYEADGSPLLEHIRRVVAATPGEARTVAWLHESLETGAISEQELLMQGLGSDELRALRLLSLPGVRSSDDVYLAHLELIAHAAGRSGDLARTVKIADLGDRRMHPRVRADGSSPPYLVALQRLLATPAGPRSIDAVA